MTKTTITNQKANRKYQISYLAFLLFFLFGALFYRQPFLAILLLLLILLPVLSVFLCRYLSQRLQITIAPKNDFVTIGFPLFLQIKFKNPTWIPLLNCRILFHYENLYYPNEDTTVFTLPAQPGKTLDYELSFQTRYAGMMQFFIKELQITDFLHLITYSIPLNHSLQCAVFPKEITLSAPAKLSKTESEFEEDFSALYGQPSGDIKEIREYVPGDRLQLIHWKMSAKADSLLVKVQEKSALHYPSFLLELQCDTLQDTLTTFYALGNFFLSQNEFFQVMAFCKSDQSFTPILVNDKESLQKAMLSLYLKPSYPAPYNVSDIYRQRYGSESCFIYIHGTTIKEMGNL